MSDFPNSIYSPRTMQNRNGVEYNPENTKTFYAEDLNNISDEIVAIENWLKNMSEGSLWNGKIVPSVSLYALTLSLKTLAGNNPSTSDPVFVMINGTIHIITSALSVTCGSGTNWFGAGSSEFATFEIDYFAYLGYNETDGVTLGFARLPGKTNYGQFSHSDTSEKFLAVSDESNAENSDPYINIGRFSATLGVAATYYWSVPTFTPANLIQYPISYSRWLTYSPVLTYGADLSGFNLAKYKVEDKICFVNFNANGKSVSTSGVVLVSLPFSATSYYHQLSGQIYDNSSWLVIVPYIDDANPDRVAVYKTPARGTWAGSESTVYIWFSGFFELS